MGWIRQFAGPQEAPGRPSEAGRKGLRPQRPLPLPDLLPGRHVARAAWLQPGGGPAAEGGGPGGEGEGTQRVGGSAGRCGVTMTTVPEAACEVTRTRLAQSHVSGGGGGGAAPGPRPLPGPVPVLVVRSPAGIRAPIPGPLSRPPVRCPPSHTSLDLSCRHIFGPGTERRESHWCWGAGTAWNVGSSATEKAGDGEIGTQKGQQAHPENGAGWGWRAEKFRDRNGEAQGESNRKRMD